MKRFKFKLVWSVFLAIWLSSWLAGCGEAVKPTPDYSSILTPVADPKPTNTPPFQAAPNITVPATAEAALPTARPETTPTQIPNTPVLKPTPTAPEEGVLTSDELGLGTWSDTEVLWSPKGDVFLLHILRENADTDLYYLVRPPDSVQGSFSLPRSAFAAMNWSPDGRFLSYIAKEGESAAGPVKVIDLQNNPSRDTKVFAGPCTAANWSAPGKLVAACGLAVYMLDDELEPNAKTDAPEQLYKLENNRFPNLDVEISLIFNALPSPDGTTLALFGLRRQRSNSALPLGEIGFLNLATKKLQVLNRDNRPVTLIDWTPDSKNLILRNITGDWAVPYTFDFYLADPTTLKISQNLTKTNDKCDPVLGNKPDCQGLQPSTVQSSRVYFSPTADRYFYVASRYVSRPGAALTSAERLYSRKSKGDVKTEQLIETAPGDKIAGFTWLPGGRYFYSVASGGSAAAKAYVDGKPVEISSKKGNSPGTRSVTPAPTKSGSVQSALSGFSWQSEPVTTTVAAPAPTTSAPAQPTVAVTTPPPAPAETTVAVPATTAPVQTTSPATTAPAETTAPPNVPPTPSPTALPRGTSLLRFDTATAEARFSPTPVPVRATPRPTSVSEPVTPADARFPRVTAYYLSPTGSWVLAVERIANSDKTVQFQVRLLPYTLR